MSKTLEKKTLRQWREELGLRQCDLADLAGCVQTTVGSIERGEVSLKSGAAQQVLAALEELGIASEQIRVAKLPEDEVDVTAFDTASDDISGKSLRWWRERRALSLRALWRLSGVGMSALSSLENGHSVKSAAITKRKLCKALQIRPDQLTLPGDSLAIESDSLESTLRAELRGARRALRKSYDFLREDPNIAFRALEKRDALLKDVEREIRGT